MTKYIRSTTTYTRLPIFYGDDGRRVKTIYVSNIRERTTVASVESKYSVYGPVQSCTVQCHPDSDERYAIVTMDYAYDAAKILHDWPDEVKHLYSQLPKRMTKNVTESSRQEQDLPKKQIIQRINRIELPSVIKVNLEKCAPPSVALISRNDVVAQNHPVEQILAPVVRRRRVVKTTSLKVKERTRVEEPDTQTQRLNRLETRETKSVDNEHSKNETIIAQKLCDATVVAAVSSSTCQQVESNPFTSLNDDCLISIFSFCDKLDLVNLAVVCNRFRFIVYNYLKAKMSKMIDLNKIKSCGKLTIGEATRVLKFIDAPQNLQQLELTMSGFHECNDKLILEKILNCCGPHLRCIKFNGFGFVEGFANQWKQLLHGLTTLIFHQCVFDANLFNALLKICENLVVLSVSNSNSTSCDADDYIKHETSKFKCTKLKEFRLTCCRHCGNSSELIWLLENNPNLCVLQISDIGDSVKLTGEVLESIGRFQRLEDLAFSFQNFVCNFATNLHHLIRLKELKSLSLQCDWMNISTFLRQFSQAASKQIESLSFECIDIDTSFMKSIGRFRKLKYLKLENTVVNEPSQEVFERSLMDLTYRLNNLSRFHCQLHLFTEDSLVQFVERMKKLQHFQISGLVMSLLLFMRVVSACGRRINGLKLNVVIDNYQHLNEYLDLIKSEYGKVIGIQSLYD